MTACSYCEQEGSCADWCPTQGDVVHRLHLALEECDRRVRRDAHEFLRSSFYRVCAQRDQAEELLRDIHEAGELNAQLKRRLSRFLLALGR